MPASRLSASANKASRSRRGLRSRAAIGGILQRRERLIAELSALRERGNSSRFIENAQQLLTRSWSTASWAGRERLLGNAEWLVRLEKRHDRGIGPPA